MHQQILTRGAQVLIDPDLSGPGAGQHGYISGNMRAGHYEVLDRHPRFSNAQTIGWFDAEHLDYRKPQGGRQR